MQITLHPQPSRSFGGALRNVTNAERDAVDAGASLDGRCGFADGEGVWS